MNPRNHLLLLSAVALLASAASGQQTSVVDTKHNLSTSGPGPYRAVIESRICIFCHTPHRARTNAPLWNREDSRETYAVYTSSTFGGTLGQPNGASKLCLSCHDGSIALGAIVSSETEIEMSPGYSHLNSGSSSIGTMLHDDHPVSFHYASSKGGSGQDYHDESTLNGPVELDANGYVQCTSCHDPHNNQFGSFLEASDRHSGLCLSCHDPSDWPGSSHQSSNATWDGVGTDPWPTANYATVDENACANCHVPHGAGHPQRLLEDAAEEQNCLKCHNGHVANFDIGNEIARISAHVPAATLGVHDPVEDPLSMARHAECQDCHNPHAVLPGSAAAPGVPGPLTGVGGINTSGQVVSRISNGYELCYKCHADNNSGVANIPRFHQQTNVRFEFDPQNPSYHPIEAPGVNQSVPSLKPPYTTQSIIACTDCHQSNNSPDAGGSGPAGPHGSNFSPILIANYRTEEYVEETASAYALCYRCHSRESIKRDESFEEHDKHIRGDDVSCSACHDSHGISSSQGNSTNNSNLINFNVSYVTPNSRGELEFIDEGFRRGRCNLLCHGENHRDYDYQQ